MRYKTFLYLVFMLLFFTENKSQTNLVPNYSFEDLVNPCSSGLSTFDLSNWYSINFESPEYYNSCANSYGYPSSLTIPYNQWGYQFPKTGNGYIGLAMFYPFFSDTINYFCEHLSVKLNKPLKANTCYYGEFYTTLINSCEYATNRIAMLLTPTIFTTAIGSFTNSIQPQIEWDTTKYFTDTLNWVKISGSFIAQGGEEYLTLGSFKNGYHTKIKKVLSNFISASFIADRKYAYHYFDDIVLFECSDTIPIIPEIPLIIPNVFTPNNDGVNDVFKIELKNVSLTNFSIYDRWGLLIKSDDLKTHTTTSWDGRTTAGEPCTAGVYFYTLEYTNSNGEGETKKGYITLLK
jgi:gliding motility-associated-like protein